MTLRFAAICVDSVDPEPLAEFWCAALGWVLIAREADGVSIGPTDGNGPQLDFFEVPEVKAGKNRLHIDLRPYRATMDEELQRLVALGARHADIGQAAEVPWVVLADPEGNEFCLLSPSS